MVWTSTAFPWTARSFGNSAIKLVQKRPIFWNSCVLGAYFRILRSFLHFPANFPARTALSFRRLRCSSQLERRGGEGEVGHICSECQLLVVLSRQTNLLLWYFTQEGVLEPIWKLQPLFSLFGRFYFRLVAVHWFWLGQKSVLSTSHRFIFCERLCCFSRFMGQSFKTAEPIKKCSIKFFLKSFC